MAFSPRTNQPPRLASVYRWTGWSGSEVTHSKPQRQIKLHMVRGIAISRSVGSRPPVTSQVIIQAVAGTRMLFQAHIQQSQPTFSTRKMVESRPLKDNAFRHNCSSMHCIIYWEKTIKGDEHAENIDFQSINVC